MKRGINDSLASILGALGDPTRDKAAGVYFLFPYVPDDQLLNAYRGDWIAKKIVNIPAEDSVREWREWKAKPDQIETIEAEEKRLGLQEKIKLARIKARLFGGAGIFIGTGPGDLAQPLDPERISKGGIKYLTVLSRLDLKAIEVEWDPASERFGQAAFYEIASPNGTRNAKIHPSRLMLFQGAPHPEPRYNFGTNWGWGDSVLVAAMDAIKQASQTYANIASMMFEAQVDVIKIKDFMDQVAEDDFETRMLRRWILAASAKSINRTLLIDSEEDFERKGGEFANLDALIDKFMQQVAGAADIPATRFLGMSPAGMSATGESDLRNYYDAVSSYQKNEMSPIMHVADEALIRSALGSRPIEIYFEWKSLWQLTPKERSDIGKINSETAVNLQRTGLIKDEALSQAVINQATELGNLPGLDQIVDDVGEVDFVALEQHAAAVQQATLTQMTAPKPGAKITKDMAPTSLYISRKVENSAAIIKWAKSQGFESVLLAGDLHVTVAFSRDPVDWFKVGEPWSSELTIKEGGPRAVEQFGSGSIVLHFACSELDWRNQRVLDLGGSSDYEEYSPHITITYNGSRVDLSTIEPYTGKIVLGPEIFKPVVEGWSKTIKEREI